ncbi:MAG: efflux RND transporter permease subunit [Gemmatimonadales bacterium]
MIRWAAGRPAVVWATGVSLILAGGVAFTKLPLATKTRVELPTLTVATQWPGASPELVETYVTSPIEEAVQSVRGVKKASSESTDGSSQLTIELQPGTDLTIARLEIHERLELLRSRFPLGVSSPTVSNEVAQELEEEPLIRYTLSGPYTPGSLSRIATERVEPRLSAVPGVSSVGTFGVSQNGVSVAYDAARLRQLGIDPQLLSAAIRDARMVQALGEERRGSNVITVALRDQPSALADLERLPIRARSGRVFRLGELASVRPEEDAGGRFYRLNGVTAVGLIVYRLPGADAIHTARRVRQAMVEAAAGLPPGVAFRLENDESVELAKQLRELVIRGAVAFLAVIVVLAFVLRNFTSIWLVVGSAAVAIAGTALGLYLLEIPANLLTLAGLGMGIGVLVQNGIVVVERLRHAPDTPDGRAAAGRQITPAVLGSTLTTAVVLFPFLYLQGDARAAFLPFAAAFLLGLGWSVAASVIMIPAVGAGHGLAKRQWRPLHRGYTKLLIRLLRWRWATIAVSLGLLVAAGYGFAKKVPRSSFGDWFGQRTTLNVSVGFPRGSDPQSLDRVMREFEQIAVGQGGVQSVVTQGFTGRGMLQVTFEREAGLTALPLVMQEEMTQRAVFVGGATISVFGRGPIFSSGGGSASVSFRIKVLGYSYSGVEQVARDLQARLERIPRVREVNINAGSFFRSERAMSVTLTPDRDALSRVGVTVSDFAGAVAREISGAVGGQRLELDGEEVLVNLKAEGARERSLDELRRAIVPTPAEAPAKVADLSELGEREGLAAISREDQQYVRIVSYDFRGPPRLANRTHEAFMASIVAPPGYSVDDERFEWQTDDSAKGLWLVFALGVTLVVLAVALVFDSTWAALMVLTSLPVALAGVAAIFWATGTSFGREAAVGVIVVVGLAVNQAILLVHGTLERRRARAAREAVIGGASEKPIGAAQVAYVARDRAG